MHASGNKKAKRVLIFVLRLLINTVLPLTSLPLVLSQYGKVPIVMATAVLLIRDVLL